MNETGTPSGGALHRSAAEGFARGAETYVRGRPDYPPEAQDWLRNDLGLRSGATVIELGAGTGKFTKYLLATGARVLAVEPVAEMLEQLSGNLARAVGIDRPRVEAVVGDAERIPFGDGVADAVVCAQSLHWFATPPALAEMRRVLKPGGTLGLIWNVRDQSVDWVAKITHIIAPYEGDAPRYEKGEWRRLFPAEGFGPLAEKHIPHGHTGSPGTVIVDRVASISFIAALSPDERATVVRGVWDLIASTPELRGRDEVTFPYVTGVYHCQRL